MDAYTLVVACALAATIMAISMGLLYLSGSRQRCLLDWSAAGACFAVSSVCGAIAIHLRGDSFLMPGIANAFYIGGHFGVLAGLRRKLGRRSGWKPMMAAGALVVVLHALPFVHHSVTHRLLVFTPVVAAINLAAARLVWRRPNPETRPAWLPLMALELLFSLQLVLRSVYLVASGEPPLTFMGSQFLQTSGSLFLLVFLLVAMMSCAQVVMHQQALALRRASMTDALTGRLNRRALFDIAAREFARCRRSGATLHILAFDIDHFKAINDRYGHAVGDEALCHVTALAAGVLRGCDALFRTGGEEFAVLFGEAEAAGVRIVAERLREQVALHPLQASGGAVPVTVSVGVAALRADDADWEGVLGRADAALYHAKQHGRNRVCVADEVQAPAQAAAA